MLEPARLSVDLRRFLENTNIASIVEEADEPKSQSGLLQNVLAGLPSQFVVTGNGDTARADPSAEQPLLDNSEAHPAESDEGWRQEHPSDQYRASEMAAAPRHKLERRQHQCG